LASSKLGGEDPEREIAFPYVGNFEVLQEPARGKRIAGIVPIGLGKMVFPKRSSARPPYR